MATLHYKADQSVKYELSISKFLTWRNPSRGTRIFTKKNALKLVRQSGVSKFWGKTAASRGKEVDRRVISMNRSAPTLRPWLCPRSLESSVYALCLCFIARREFCLYSSLVVWIFIRIFVFFSNSRGVSVSKVYASRMNSMFLALIVSVTFS
jgi:hypothetical protein